MASSLRDLANLLDGARKRGAVINETAEHIVVSSLASDDAMSLRGGAEILSLVVRLVDGAEMETNEIQKDFEPYRLTIDKPSFAGTTLIVSLEAFQKICSDADLPPIILVPALRSSFYTFSTLFANSEVDLDESFIREDFDATRLVRTYGQTKIPLSGIGSFIAKEPYDNQDCLFHRAWKKMSLARLLQCLANEVDGEQLIFKGNGVLKTALPSDSLFNDEAHSLVQEVVSWIFQSGKEFELKHKLFAAEISRLPSRFKTPEELMVEYAAAALEGAKIAYELSVSGLSKDSLTLLNDLRKNVVEEAAKLTEISRQLIVAVASTFLAGTGLILVRFLQPNQAIATKLGILFLAGILLVYVIAVIHNGRKFIMIQKEIREEWRTRVYNYIPAEEYDRMVETPLTHIEATYSSSAIVAVCLSITLFMSVLLSLFV